MENYVDKYNKNTFTEEESGFDFKEWFFHFLRYWYLFLIGIIIALGASYLKNRSWLPRYQTAGTMIIEDRGYSGGGGSQAIMQGFGIQSGYRNINNQVIMLQSYDLLTRVVDSLPFMRVDYLNKGTFITRNLYNYTPIYVSFDYLSADAYNHLYKIAIKPDNSFVITLDGEKNDAGFRVEGIFGEKISNDLFDITIFNVRDFNRDTDLYFRFRTKESLINEFYYRLQFSYVMEGSSILQVSLASETPSRDIDFINKLCEIFIADNLNLKNKAAVKTINFIDEQLDVLLKSLSVSEGEMTQFRQQNQIIDVSSYAGNILSKATNYDNRKRELELRETYLDYLVDYVNRNVSSGVVVAPSTLGLNEPMLMQLVQKINAQFNELDELSDRNPYYEKLLRDIENTKNAISELVSSMRLSLNIEKDEVQKRLAELDIEMRNLPRKELEMIAIERRYRVDDTYYTFFLQKRAEAEIQKASNNPDNAILDRARIMSLTNAKTKSNNIVTYLFLGILLPFLIILVIKLLNTRITSVKEVEKNSSFPVIASVMHTKNQDPMLPIKKPRSSFAEMFRVIRTRIEFIVQRKTNIMVTITSAESGDGKTYFSANLASVYAMTQRKTLLVDLDIRKPNLYEIFNIPNEPGITNYLIGEDTLENVISHTDNEFYDVLTTGPIPPNPGELVRSEKLKDMFNELKKHYEYIIVDTSPIGLVADTYPIAMISDVNLFVTRMNKTDKNGVKRITEQLKEDNLPSIYTIINDVSAEKGRYAKYSNYSYSYYGKKLGKNADKLNPYHKYYTDDDI